MIRTHRVGRHILKRSSDPLAAYSFSSESIHNFMQRSFAHFEQKSKFFGKQQLHWRHCINRTTQVTFMPKNLITLNMEAGFNDIQHLDLNNCTNVIICKEDTVV